MRRKEVGEDTLRGDTLRGDTLRGGTLWGGSVRYASGRSCAVCFGVLFGAVRFGADVRGTLRGGALWGGSVRYALGRICAALPLQQSQKRVVSGAQK